MSYQTAWDIELVKLKVEFEREKQSTLKLQQREEIEALRKRVEELDGNYQTLLDEYTAAVDAARQAGYAACEADVVAWLHSIGHNSFALTVECGEHRGAAAREGGE